MSMLELETINKQCSWLFTQLPSPHPPHFLSGSFRMSSLYFSTDYPFISALSPFYTIGKISISLVVKGMNCATKKVTWEASEDSGFCVNIRHVIDRYFLFNFVGPQQITLNLSVLLKNIFIINWLKHFGFLQAISIFSWIGKHIRQDTNTLIWFVYLYPDGLLNMCSLVWGRCREYWMIDKGPGVLAVLWFGSSPTPSRPSPQKVVSLF